MSSSRRAVGLALLFALCDYTSVAEAQTPVKGFAVERFYPSAPGGGWLVMDEVDMHGGIGGALSLTMGYARNPLRVGEGSQAIAVISDQAFADIGAAITWDRFRFYLNLATPLVIRGQAGNSGDYSFSGPAVDLGSNTDTLSDARIGADVRIAGRPGSAFRFGAGAQLYIPSGDRADYDTDGTFRGMVRVLFAGDVSRFTWAAHLGVHIRPLDDSPAPGSPRGSELLFGAAAGARLPFGQGRKWQAIIGPEVYGASAFRAFGDSNGTALEGLIGGRIEGTRDDRMQLRIKWGVGAGFDHQFGAAEWRVVVGVELFNHNSPAGNHQTVD